MDVGRVPFSRRTAVRQTLRSGHSTQRLFSMRRLKAIRASAPLSTGGASPPYRKTECTRFWVNIWRNSACGILSNCGVSRDPSPSSKSGWTEVPERHPGTSDRSSVDLREHGDADRTVPFSGVDAEAEFPGNCISCSSKSGSGGCEIALQNVSASFAALPMSLRRYSGT